MALHKDFPQSPHAILDPGIRWFPADEALRESSMEKLMPPLVAELRRKVKEFRDGGYVGAADTSRSLLNWWFIKPHLLPKAYLPSPSGRGAGGEGMDVPLKLARLAQWCEDINRVQTDVAYDFVYVDEESFEKYKPTSFRQLLEAFKKYKGEI
jgi:hypothetical protein